ncbi:hypothetical protein CEXT_726971 [Caerostris extrusa]|uniref:Secreted protein n=1 Tax=Caerostris extrusa TaxID=172846 RepID=A0AAV4Y1W4_CAEEX|nr:hypothetical protein CEXT_726971 [Caerostris extrusa]
MLGLKRDISLQLSLLLVAVVRIVGDDVSTNHQRVECRRQQPHLENLNKQPPHPPILEETKISSEGLPLDTLTRPAGVGIRGRDYKCRKCCSAILQLSLLLVAVVRIVWDDVSANHQRVERNGDRSGDNFRRTYYKELYFRMTIDIGPC